MSYVIVNRDTGKYVAPPGLPKSYTGKLQDARIFETREAAQAECCGNEYVKER